jgi:hypothetical protein
MRNLLVRRLVQSCCSFHFNGPLGIFSLMLALLRRSRTMALAMVLLVPGITGSAVQWLHACPAEAQAQASADHQHHDSAPSQPGHSQACECIGSCNTAGVVAPVKTATVLAAVILPDQRATLSTDPAFVPAGLPSDLLPPATAPPLA